MRGSVMSGRHETCPVCKNFILTERLEVHMATHQAEVATREAERKERLQEALANPYCASSNFFEKHGPNLDATKDMCYPARENGNYGSHPSHDGMDDESQS
jgi:hypothetical protein